MMHKLLDTVTAQIPTGVPPQRKLFRVKSGLYAGRLVLLYAKTANAVVLTWADSPFSSWSSPQTIISDSADYPFSATIDPNGNIYLAYTRQTSLNLIYLKLTFSAGNWLAGTPVVICNAGACYYLSIAKSTDPEMWCAFSLYNSAGGTYTVRAKVSYDGGATWGSGPTDSGLQLSDANPAMPYTSLIYLGLNLYAVYSQARSNLFYRRQNGSGGDWGEAIAVASSDYIDADFDCAASSDGKLGITVCPSTLNKIYFREFDGLALGGLQEIAQINGRAPQLIYIDSKPHFFFAKNAGNGFWIPSYIHKNGTAFICDDLIGGIGLFDKVFVYNESAASKFEDKTTAAANLISADIYHSSSNSLLSAAGDCVYIGRNNKFFCAAIVLSTAGVGGQVVWEYFNGSVWVNFTPSSGAYSFNQSNQQVVFWEDMESAPSAWQCNLVNSSYMYWLRARVINAFTTPPIGTQIMAVPKVNHLCKTLEVS